MGLDAQKSKILLTDAAIFSVLPQISFLPVCFLSHSLYTAEDFGNDVSTNGISKLAFTILSAVAEAKRNRICERVQEAKADQRARGRYLGGSQPFDWDIGLDGAMVPRADEQAALRTMRDLRGKGVSLRGIAQHLARAGHQVSHMTVRQALTSTTGSAEL